MARQRRHRQDLGRTNGGLIILLEMMHQYSCHSAGLNLSLLYAVRRSTLDIWVKQRRKCLKRSVESRIERTLTSGVASKSSTLHKMLT